MHETIGFIGIGNMGLPMALNLVNAGYKLLAYDTNSEQVQRLVSSSDAIAAASLAELGKEAGIIITMLPTGQDVQKVMLEMEHGGLATSLKTGTLLIDMSSSDPLGTRELGTQLAEYGIQFVDAPVSGGVPGAENATLAIMLGSDSIDAIERARPILTRLGKNLFETGSLGTGHAMKSLNNFVAGAGFIAISEALIAGRNFGLKPEVMLAILNSSTGRSFNSEFTFVNHVLKQAYTTGFKLALVDKDLRIASNLGKGLGLDLPMTQLASERWGEVLNGLGGDSDFTEAYAYLEKSIKPK